MTTYGSRVIAAVGLLALGGGAQAGLTPYGSDGASLVYVPDRDLTWTADANLFKTQYHADNTVVSQIIAAVPILNHSGSAKYPSPHTMTSADFDTASGQMSWFGAMAWTQWLGSIRYGGADDWRMPWTAQPDPTCSSQYDPGGGFPLQGWNYYCTGSEMGHLFYVEGGLDSFDGINESPALTSVFSNMHNGPYKSGTEYAPRAQTAWVFSTEDGLQGTGDKGARSYAWAVRSGQVGAAPLPGTAVLMALGLLGIAACRLGRQATSVIR